MIQYRYLQNRRGFVEIIIMGAAAFLGLVGSVVLLSLNSARMKARDAKRIADVRMIGTALELYRNDNNGYPGALFKLSPTYLQLAPQAPTPPDGQCTSDQNEYTYTHASQLEYTLSFCLGNATGGYPAGMNTLTAPSEIKPRGPYQP